MAAELMGETRFNCVRRAGVMAGVVAFEGAVVALVVSFGRAVVYSQ